MKLADERKNGKSALVLDGSPSEWKPMFTVTSDIREVEPQWRALEAFGIQSQGRVLTLSVHGLSNVKFQFSDSST